MIKGLGTDIIEVERVAGKISKESGFREMVFSREEIEYCESKTHKFEHYAARFAAKESFLKALGTGWAGGVLMNEIEIRPDEKGKPELVLIGQTALSLQSWKNWKIHVSMSHLKMIAMAIVIIEI
jgi:holo-[acyl-carrier protein] synthase